MYLFICMYKSKYAMAFITQTMAAATTTETAAAVVVTHTCLFQFKKLRNFGIIYSYIHIYILQGNIKWNYKDI